MDLMLNVKTQLTLTSSATTVVWILAAVFCSLYAKAKTDIQHGHKYKMHVLTKRKWSWLCYHIKFPDSQLPSKALTYFNATNVSMVKDSI